MHRVRFSWRLLSTFDPHSLNDALGSFDPAFGSSNVHRNPALLLSSLGATASRVAAGVADRVSGQRLKASLNQSCGGVRFGGLRPAGIEGLRAGERATAGRHAASEDTFLTLGMQRWRTGMRLQNVRASVRGGASGRQNFVGESLLRGQ
jgi:hypothetical protein